VNYKNADIVFTGKVINIREYISGDSCQNAPEMLVEFEVTEIQKGRRRAQILLKTSPVNDSEYMFEKGKEYLVYAERKKEPGCKYFISIRQTEVFVGEINPDMQVLYRLVKKNIFRRVKPPLPKYVIGKGCNCG
jgi:hypothetical protein